MSNIYEDFVMDIRYTDGAIDEVICTDASVVHLESMGEGAWCLIIDNAQGNWMFDITHHGLTLHEGPEGQWKPSLEDIALAESFGRTVPGWMLWLLVQWDRAKEIWAKARH
jgi:hypothetical protein